MTYEELLAKINRQPVYSTITDMQTSTYHLPSINYTAQLQSALRAVVELHKPITIELCDDEDCCGCGDPDFICSECQSNDYPCPTIQAIEKELK